VTFGSLFAGIGGFDLGFERAGMRCVWQVEIDPFCQKVLGKHWPLVRRHDDVRTFPPEPVDDWRCDVICGGFPCQDISNAGRRAGIEGERSGLWGEYARIIRVLRPHYVVVENVAALLVRGLGRVLGDLAEGGYDAEWDCIPAAAVGAAHIRDRLFLVGTRDGANSDVGRFFNAGRTTTTRQAEGVQGSSQERERVRTHAQPVGEVVADAASGRRQAGTGLRRDTGASGRRESLGGGEAVADSVGHRLERHLQARDSVQTCFGIDAGRALAGAGEQGRREQWSTEPDVGRVAHGVPSRVDRLRGLGNAVVPQVAEFIGRRLMSL
jgi:DNA (cytosine-5)-methyltransferase 1